MAIIFWGSFTGRLISPSWLSGKSNGSTSFKENPSLHSFVFGFLGSNPSPVPHRLMTSPAAGHPLPKGEGGQR
jgi:hypothetical protein